MIRLLILLMLLGIVVMGLWRSNFGVILRGRLKPVIVSVLRDINS